MSISKAFQVRFILLLSLMVKVDSWWKSCTPRCEMDHWQPWGACKPPCGREAWSVRKRDILAQKDCKGKPVCKPIVQERAACGRKCHYHGRITGSLLPAGCLCYAGWQGLCCNQDLNECASNSGRGPCHFLATCANSVGSFSCTCRRGFIGNGIACYDHNECTNGPCSLHGWCHNQWGSFRCFCNAGFHGNGFVCHDINECDSKPCSLFASCINTFGSFICVCFPGYSGNGKECKAVDYIIPVNGEENLYKLWQLATIVREEDDTIRSRFKVVDESTELVVKDVDVVFNFHPVREYLKQIGADVMVNIGKGTNANTVVLVPAKIRRYLGNDRVLLDINLDCGPFAPPLSYGLHKVYPRRPDSEITVSSEEPYPFSRINARYSTHQGKKWCPLHKRKGEYVKAKLNGEWKICGIAMNGMVTNNPPAYTSRARALFNDKYSFWMAMSAVNKPVVIRHNSPSWTLPDNVRVTDVKIEVDAWKTVLPCLGFEVFGFQYADSPDHVYTSDQLHLQKCHNLKTRCPKHARCITDAGYIYRCRCKDGFVQSVQKEFFQLHEVTITCTDIDECSKNLCAVTSDCQNYPGSYRCVCKLGYVGDGKACKELDPSLGSVGSSPNPMSGINFILLGYRDKWMPDLERSPLCGFAYGATFTQSEVTSKGCLPRRTSDLSYDLEPTPDSIEVGSSVIFQVGVDDFKRKSYAFAVVTTVNRGRCILKVVGHRGRGAPVGLRKDKFLVARGTQPGQGSITASSELNANHAAIHAVLRDGLVWCPGNHDQTRPWIKIDLARKWYVTQIEAQGNVQEWTQEFTIASSLKSLDLLETWKGEDGYDLVFSREPVAGSYKILLDVPATLARYIGFFPIAFFGRPCLGVEVYGWGFVTLFDDNSPPEVPISLLRHMPGASRCMYKNNCTKNSHCIPVENQVAGTYRCACDKYYEDSLNAGAFSPDDDVACVYKPCQVKDACKNGGKCIQLTEFDYYVCDCSPEWSGRFCEVPTRNVAFDYLQHGFGKNGFPELKKIQLTSQNKTHLNQKIPFTDVALDVSLQLSSYTLNTKVLVRLGQDSKGKTYYIPAKVKSVSPDGSGIGIQLDPRKYPSFPLGVGLTPQQSVYRFNTVPDSNFSAPDSLANALPYYARMMKNNTLPWCSFRRANDNIWLKVDIGFPTFISRFGTRGSPISSASLTAFQIVTSLVDKEDRYTVFTDKSGAPMTFKMQFTHMANLYDLFELNVQNALDRPHRFFKLVGKAFYGWPCVGLEIWGYGDTGMGETPFLGTSEARIMASALTSPCSSFPLVLIPCPGNSTCVNKPRGVVGMPYCKCSKGYEPSVGTSDFFPGAGVTCIVKDPCRNNPCMNGGTCTANGHDNYTCTCAAPWKGNNCDQPPFSVKVKYLIPYVLKHMVHNIIDYRQASFAHQDQDTVYVDKLRPFYQMERLGETLTFKKQDIAADVVPKPQWISVGQSVLVKHDVDQTEYHTYIKMKITNVDKNTGVYTAAPSCLDYNQEAPLGVHYWAQPYLNWRWKGLVEDSQITAKSSAKGSSKDFARLENRNDTTDKRWCPDQNDVDKPQENKAGWVMYDFKQHFYICHVATDGSKTSWVKNMNVQFSDGSTWENIESVLRSKGSGIEVTKVEKATPFRYARISPIEYEQYPCLGAEFYTVGSTSRLSNNFTIDEIRLFAGSSVSNCELGEVCQKGYKCTSFDASLGSVSCIDIDECLANPCLNGGTCINTPGNYTCKCTSTRKGRNCERFSDGCFYKPCMNGGTCHSGGSDFYLCTCPLGWKGKHCTIDVNECAETPCKNGGTCVNSQGSFTCKCSPQFSGANCEQDVDECKVAGICKNGGTCINLLGGVKCVCPPGWLADDCSQDVDECVATRSPCKNNGTCTNTQGSYTCSCPPQWKGSTCEVDVDECKVAVICKNGGTCINLLGGVKCVCPPGWLADDCSQDVDECAATRSPCKNMGTCTNTQGSYTCSCPPQWKGSTCEVDVNECVIDQPCKNGGTCINQAGGFSCSCPTGWTGHHCTKDVDECNTSPCKHGGTCHNTPGSYTCSCIPQFTGENCELDVNECLTNPCWNEGICANLVGDFLCTCPKEFTGKTCEQDVNECEDGVCENGGTCINDIGSYSCTCSPGWSARNCEKDVNECSPTNPCKNGGTCFNTLGSYMCMCKGDWLGKHCEADKDECQFSYCKNGATCDNVKGGYKCSCAKGWTGKNCDKDVNECDTNPCSNGGTCYNTVGSYSCLCRSGWTGKNCTEDVNECLQASPCSKRGKCVNLIGSYKCECAAGWEGSKCEKDANECLTSPCKHDGTCVNSYGNYVCMCIQGWQGANCHEDVDECLKSPCSNTSICVNTPGSYRCSCLPGWQGNKCDQDIDECKNSPCKYGTCTNTAGSYTCACDAGKGFKGENCDEDIDECASFPCKTPAICENLPGSYSCSCRAGWIGHNCDQPDCTKAKGCIIEWPLWSPWEATFPEGTCGTAVRRRMPYILNQYYGESLDNCMEHMVEHCEPIRQTAALCSCPHISSCQVQEWSSWTGMIPPLGCANEHRKGITNHTITYELKQKCRTLNKCASPKMDYRITCNCAEAVCQWSEWYHEKYDGVNGCDIHIRYRNRTAEFHRRLLRDDCRLARRFCNDGKAESQRLYIYKEMKKGESVSFNCEHAERNHRLDLLFLVLEHQKDKALLELVADKHKLVRNGYSYTIKNLGFHDIGRYFCKVISPEGNVTHTQIGEVIIPPIVRKIRQLPKASELADQMKPFIVFKVKSPYLLSLSDTRNMVFKVLVLGKEPIQITWMKGGVEISPNTRTVILKDKSQFILKPPFSWEDDGFYDVMACNKNGCTMRGIQLFIYESTPRTSTLQNEEELPLIVKIGYAVLFVLVIATLSTVTYAIRLFFALRKKQKRLKKSGKYLTPQDEQKRKERLKEARKSRKDAKRDFVVIEMEQAEKALDDLPAPLSPTVLSAPESAIEMKKLAKDLPSPTEPPTEHENLDMPSTLTSEVDLLLLPYGSIETLSLPEGIEMTASIPRPQTAPVPTSTSILTARDSKYEGPEVTHIRSRTSTTLGLEMQTGSTDLALLPFGSIETLSLPEHIEMTASIPRPQTATVPTSTSILTARDSQYEGPEVTHIRSRTSTTLGLTAVEMQTESTGLTVQGSLEIPPHEIQGSIAHLPTSMSALDKYSSLDILSTDPSFPVLSSTPVEYLRLGTEAKSLQIPIPTPDDDSRFRIHAVPPTIPSPSPFRSPDADAGVHLHAAPEEDSTFETHVAPPPVPGPSPTAGWDSRLGVPTLPALVPTLLRDSSLGILATPLALPPLMQVPDQHSSLERTPIARPPAVPPPASEAWSVSPRGPPPVPLPSEQQWYDSERLGSVPSIPGYGPGLYGIAKTVSDEALRRLPAPPEESEISSAIQRLIPPSDDSVQSFGLRVSPVPSPTADWDSRLEEPTLPASIARDSSLGILVTPLDLPDSTPVPDHDSSLGILQTQATITATPPAVPAPATEAWLISRNEQPPVPLPSEHQRHDSERLGSVSSLPGYGPALYGIAEVVSDEGLRRLPTPPEESEISSVIPRLIQPIDVPVQSDVQSSLVLDTETSSPGYTKGGSAGEESPGYGPDFTEDGSPSYNQGVPTEEDALGYDPGACTEEDAPSYDPGFSPEEGVAGFDPGVSAEESTPGYRPGVFQSRDQDVSFALRAAPPPVPSSTADWDSRLEEPTLPASIARDSSLGILVTPLDLPDSTPVPDHDSSLGILQTQATITATPPAVPAPATEAWLISPNEQPPVPLPSEHQRHDSERLGSVPSLPEYGPALYGIAEVVSDEGLRRLPTPPEESEISSVIPRLIQPIDVPVQSDVQSSLVLDTEASSPGYTIGGSAGEGSPDYGPDFTEDGSPSYNQGVPTEEDALGYDPGACTEEDAPSYDPGFSPEEGAAGFDPGVSAEEGTPGYGPGVFQSRDQDVSFGVRAAPPPVPSPTADWDSRLEEPTLPASIARDSSLGTLVTPLVLPDSTPVPDHDLSLGILTTQAAAHRYGPALYGIAEIVSDEALRRLPAPPKESEVSPVIPRLIPPSDDPVQSDVQSSLVLDTEASLPGYDPGVSTKEDSPSYDPGVSTEKGTPSNEDEAGYDTGASTDDGAAGYEQGLFTEEGAAGYEQGDFTEDGAAGYEEGAPTEEGAAGYEQGVFTEEGAAGYEQGVFTEEGSAGYEQGDFTEDGAAGYEQGAPTEEGAAGYEQGVFTEGGAAGYEQGVFTEEGAAGYEQGVFTEEGADGCEQGVFTEEGAAGYEQRVFTEEGAAGYEQRVFIEEGAAGYEQGVFTEEGAAGYKQGVFREKGAAGYEQGVFSEKGAAGYEQGVFTEEGADGCEQGVFTEEGADGCEQGVLTEEGADGCEQGVLTEEGADGCEQGVFTEEGADGCEQGVFTEEGADGCEQAVFTEEGADGCEQGVFTEEGADGCEQGVFTEEGTGEGAETSPAIPVKKRRDSDSSIEEAGSNMEEEDHETSYP